MFLVSAIVKRLIRLTFAIFRLVFSRFINCGSALDRFLNAPSTTTSSASLFLMGSANSSTRRSQMGAELGGPSSSTPQFEETEAHLSQQVPPKKSRSSSSLLLNPYAYLNDYISTWRWVSSSAEALNEAEHKLLRSVKSLVTFKVYRVWQNKYHVWTAIVENHRNRQKNDSNRIPLVLVHGLGGGLGLWIKNYDAMCHNRPIYAFDLLGFGKSGRPTFSSDPIAVEAEWVQSIEDFRREANLDKMILLGHSLGGYLACAYALEHPDRVRHLILADPWGFGAKVPESERTVQIPGWVRTIASLTSFLNPLAVLRALGPYGPAFLRRIRPDFGHKFASSGHNDTIFEYIYHCNVQPPSGEAAFTALSLPYGWAKRPMMERIRSLRIDVPVSFIYGSRSWVDCAPGYDIQQKVRPDSYVRVEVISGAGHHVYADNSEIFNALINEICDIVDSNEDCYDVPLLEQEFTTEDVVVPVVNNNNVEFYTN